MHIEPTRDPMMAAMSPSKQPTKAPELQQHDEFINSVAKLETELLQSQGEIRPEVVQRGKELLKSNAYPPLETVAKIANLLGDRIRIDD